MNRGELRLIGIQEAIDIRPCVGSMAMIEGCVKGGHVSTPQRMITPAPAPAPCSPLQLPVPTLRSHRQRSSVTAPQRLRHCKAGWLNSVLPWILGIWAVLFGGGVAVGSAQSWYDQPTDEVYKLAEEIDILLNYYARPEHARSTLGTLTKNNWNVIAQSTPLEGGAMGLCHGTAHPKYPRVVRLGPIDDPVELAATLLHEAEHARFSEHNARWLSSRLQQLKIAPFEFSTYTHVEEVLAIRRELLARGLSRQKSGYLAQKVLEIAMKEGAYPELQATKGMSFKTAREYLLQRELSRVQALRTPCRASGLRQAVSIGGKVLQYAPYAFHSYDGFTRHNLGPASLYYSIGATMEDYGLLIASVTMVPFGWADFTDGGRGPDYRGDGIFNPWDQQDHIRMALAVVEGYNALAEMGPTFPTPTGPRGYAPRVTGRGFTRCAD